MRVGLRVGQVVVVFVMVGCWGFLGGARGARADEQRGRAADCAPATVAAALRDLFPPSSPAVRAVRAAQIAACHPVGAEGALAAAARLTDDEQASLAITQALAAFSSPVATQALREAARPDNTAAVRTSAIGALASTGDVDTVLGIVGDRKEDDRLRMQALKALSATKGPPSAAYLRWLRLRAGPTLRAAIDELAPEVAALTPQPSIVPARVPTREAAGAGGAPPPAAPREATDSEPAGDAEAPPAPAVAAAPEPPPAPRGPLDGTPLAIGASTVAGAALMVNLSLLGVQDLTPQLLLGSAGAVIGFGTSWGLARFGYRPTLAQAAWFANSTAWGTLAGMTMFSASGSDNYKLRYGSLAAGEIVGMVAGAWSARRFEFTGGQLVLADSMVVGAGLGALGVARLISDDTRPSLPAAIGVVPLMIASSIVAHTLAPTVNDLRLMTLAAVDGAWVAGLVASGASRTSLFGSRQGQGGLALGLGGGYLAGVAAGAFTEASPLRLQAGEIGLVLGTGAGFGLGALASGFSRAPGDALASGESARWKLGAGLGGAALAGAGLALAPHLTPGPQAAPMIAWGTAYGAAVYALALAQAMPAGALDAGDAGRARLYGGVVVGGLAGGVAGLWSSRHFAPETADLATTTGTTLAGGAAGWGLAALLAPARGWGDALGLAGGSALGLAGGAWFTHGTRLRPPALGAAAAGLAYGGLVGALLPAVTSDRWSFDRATSGGTMLGLGAGAVLAAAVAQGTNASAGQVAVPAVGGVLGLTAGAGAGLMLDVAGSPAVRGGAVIGMTSLAGGALVADHWLHLSEGPGRSAVGLSVVGASFGAAEGAFLAGLTSGEGRLPDDRRVLQGGLLLGGSLGLAGGLALSRRFAPSPGDLVFAAGASALLTSAGYGMGELAAGSPGRASSVGAMSGAAVGLLGGALLAPRLQLDGPIVLGGLAGGAAGSLMGALIPSLADERWTSSPRTDGGLRLGMAAGIAAGGLVARASGATDREVVISSLGLGLGATAGLGAGLMSGGDGTRAARIGVVAGTAAVGAATIALMRPLRLAEPLPDGTPGVVTTLALHGMWDGLWAAALLDPSGRPSSTPSRQLQGGLLLGGSVGVGAGMLLAPRTQLTGGRLLLLGAATAAGSSAGRGIGLLWFDAAGRADSAATLAGSVGGTLAGGLAAAYLTPTAPDLGGATTGAVYGATMGGLGASLLGTGSDGTDRQVWGGIMLGAGAGAATGFALRHATGSDGRDVTLTAFAGADGLVTGLGFGLLLRRPGDGTRQLRLDMLAGTAAGLGLGMASWSRLTLGPGDGGFILAATTLGAWNGFWLPRLGHADASTVDAGHRDGAVLAVAGAASFAAPLLAPFVEMSADAVTDAVVMDGLASGAGAGVGALVSARDDAPVTGLLLGGAAGLALGGVLHDRIRWDGDHAALMMAGGVEGLWAGGLLPYLLRPESDVTARQRAGAFAAGGFGGLGLGVLTSTVWTPSPGQVAFAALGSGVGAAIGGGIALAADSIHDQTAAGLTLAGTGAGLLAAGLLAPRLELSPRLVGATALGATLGTSEALLFAWSGRAGGQTQYGGAALLGAGVGAGLGLASAAEADLSRSLTPAAAGFAAWGAWMGAFSGSLFARDPHEITTGGLIGANAGLLAGVGLLQLHAVDGGDFGWLSLFGAMGTVGGAAVAAPFTSRDKPAPILAGLAIGPAAGMLAGALVLPHLHAGAAARSASISNGAPGTPGFFTRMARAVGPRRHAPRPGVDAAKAMSSSELAAVDGDSATRRFARALDQTIRVTDCAPLIGALPQPDSAPPGTPPPFIAGVTGHWQ